MTMSFEDFRASLLRSDLRGPLGLQLSDTEAQLIAADPASAQSWYAYWIAANPAPAPQGPAAPEAQPDAQPTEVIYGATGTSDPQQPFTSAPPVYPGYAQPAEPELTKKSRVGLWVTLSIVGALILIAGIVAVAAFVTARHWTKVDVEEQPETFHSEDYETGRYNVTMDALNPCTVNQDWTDCTNIMVASYNAACMDVELTELATAVCGEYNSAIDEMRSLDGDGYYVATLGTYGSLQRTAEIGTRQVSNDDYKPAVTHEAVCYFDFIGECK